MARIGIIHYQIGKTDGVSLEIEKRMNVLGRLGHTVKTISGPIQEGADYVIPELGIQYWLEQRLHEPVFANDAPLFYRRFDGLVQYLKDKFVSIITHEKFDLLYVHNILSLGRHPVSAVALLEAIQQCHVQTVAINHDIYWEREDVLAASHDLLRPIVESTHIPLHRLIRHEVINSLAQESLFQKRKIHSTVVPDMFDFDQPRWVYDSYVEDFRQTFGIDPAAYIVLQATRIVPRKAIELAIDFVARLKAASHKDAVLFLSNYVDTAEPSAIEYAAKLEQRAKRQNVQLIWGHTFIRPKREIIAGRKYYSFWDAYAVCDLVTYPSLVEGWGNQFLEAVFAHKIPVVFEYPVFKKDILPEGYTVVSLGDTLMGTDDQGLQLLPESALTKAVDTVMPFLLRASQQEITKHNFLIGKRNHSLDRLQKHLQKQVSTLHLNLH